jgi:hypothetical protein
MSCPMSGGDGWTSDEVKARQRRARRVEDLVKKDPGAPARGAMWFRSFLRGAGLPGKRSHCVPFRLGPGGRS